jgi:hypothetical protein
MRRRLGASVAVLCAATLVAAGCRSPDQAAGAGAQAVVERGPAPDYGAVAVSYNQRVERLASLIAPAVVRFTYRDEEGHWTTDQGEGTLQVVRPDRVALSIGKAGKRLFWFGCDAERYWWFDLVDKRIASVGRHDRFDPDRPGGPGLAISPLDVALLLSISPLPVPAADEPAAGATQWSEDGRWLGVTTRTDSDGYQRLWLDPTTLEPAKVELFSPDRVLVVVADLGDYRHVRITGYGGVGPRVPARLVALHQPSGTVIRLDLSAIEDGSGKVSPAAFEFEALRRLLQVERVVDLDEGVDQPAHP